MSLLAIASFGHCHATEPSFAIEQQTDSLDVFFDGRPVASYVFRDADLPRPYLMDVHAPGGQQLTRNHPPIEGQDKTDHADMHPGIWLAFGDMSGSDFWRNKAQVIHERFVEAPSANDRQASFAVKNRYQAADGSTVCYETCELNFLKHPTGYLLTWDSQFSHDKQFSFGDQEEMGLGIRVNTSLSVERGGTMRDSEGRLNGKEIGGQKADWCDDSGVVDGTRLGITIMCHPENFRPCWMHARDYGLIAANPFGRQAFTKGEPSNVTIQPGEQLRLRYGILLHSADHSTQLDLPAVYAAYVKL